MNTAFKALTVAALALGTSVLGGCYVEEEGPPPNAPVADADVYEGYRPMYYNGYVVYYDGAARPYYYYRGGAVYVPRGYVGYNGLVGHYYRYRGVYAGWHARYGARYRGWRRW